METNMKTKISPCRLLKSLFLGSLLAAPMLAFNAKADLSRGRKCQIYAVYTAKRDVTRRLERVLSHEGIRVSILTAQVPPDQREAWYERELRSGMQVCVAHPRLVSVGMDLLWAPSIYFVQTGYSI